MSIQKSTFRNKGLFRGRDISAPPPTPRPGHLEALQCTLFTTRSDLNDTNVNDLLSEVQADLVHAVANVL